MILSNVEIHKAIDEGRIILDPEPQPRLPGVQGPHCPYDTHSVDVTLGDAIRIPAEHIKISIDLADSAGSVIDTIIRNSTLKIISRDSPFKLEPGKFILGAVRERLALPLHSDPERSLSARIEGKSSRARFGLLIHFTAPTVHPGYEGNLALEMIKLGPWPFLLSPDMPIAQLVFEEIRGVPVRNDSQFQGQSDPAGGNRPV